MSKTIVKKLVYGKIEQIKAEDIHQHYYTNDYTAPPTINTAKETYVKIYGYTISLINLSQINVHALSMKQLRCIS